MNAGCCLGSLPSLPDVAMILHRRFWSGCTTGWTMKPAPWGLILLCPWTTKVFVDSIPSFYGIRGSVSFLCYLPFFTCYPPFYVLSRLFSLLVSSYIYFSVYTILSIGIYYDN
ncbi:hypothetical protein Dimus_035435 [Dionaea muscipula]